MVNHAAFTRDDVADARRGHPAVTLDGYAAHRALEPVGQQLIGHTAGLNPVWADHVFNALRGELVPGRFGTVQHELYGVSLADDGHTGMPGTYHGRRTATRLGLHNLVGWRTSTPNRPFPRTSMWLPTTAVKVLVPEVALLPRFLVRTKANLPLSEPTLRHAPGFRMASSRWVGTDQLAALDAALGPTLSALGTTFAEVELRHGALGVVVDGYRHDTGALDHLVTCTAALADALADLAAPWHAPGPFAAPLGAFDPTGHPPGYVSFATVGDGRAMATLEQHATEVGMVVEDPVALHRRFARLPLPGTSLGVAAGSLPGTATPARLTWQHQGHPGSSRYLRRAAVVAARDGAETPPGGHLVPSTDMYAAARDGVAVCWTRANSEGRLDAVDLAERAAATFAETGLAAP